MSSNLSQLEIVHIRSSADRQSWLENFSGKGETWLVADVRSKLSVQRRILGQRGFVEGLAVLRASELWTMLVRRLRPDLQIVSRELILTALESRLQVRDEEWLKAPGAAKTAFEYIRQLLPILAAAQGTDGDVILDWFADDDNAASRERWSVWFKIARDVYRSLEEDKLCASSWIAGALSPVREHLASAFSRHLIVDLGAELSTVEGDLLLELAKSNRVTVFRPSPTWASDYPDCRLAVDWMASEAKARGVKVKTVEAAVGASDLSDASVAPKSLQYKRLPAAGGEIKEAVAQVREWLERGVLAAKIALAAPDIEAYWPVLSMHLEVEGIPVNKPVISVLHSFSDVARWLARIRLRSGIPQSRDIEVDLFGEVKPALSYSSFREIFSRIYEVSDLELSPELIKHYELVYDDRGRWDDVALTRDAFLARAVGVLSEGDDRSRAIRIFKAVLEECPPDVVFQCSQWTRYICELAARVEIKVIPESLVGVSCLNLRSLEGVECTHVVVMGLHEGALRNQHATAIHTFDLRSIERSTGFIIDGEDRKRTEFEARWILLQPREQTVLLYADADIGGTVQTPSWSWISGAWEQSQKTPAVAVPRATRFDELQMQVPERLGSEAQRNRIKRERGELSQNPFALGAVTSLSATTIDAVSQCSLQFAFRRILGPRDEGTLDFDADRPRQGRLQHKIFEFMGRAQWKSQTDGDLLKLIDEARTEIEKLDGKKLVRSEEAWQSLRRRMLKTARGLLEFEIEVRRKLPTLKTAACEIHFSGTHEGAPLRGQIDRIDAMPDGRMIVVDYKSQAPKQNFSQWGAKSEFWQPILYAWALAKGFVDNDEFLFSLADEPRVAGVFLYDAKRRKRGNGLRLTDGNADLFEFTSRIKGQSRDDLDKGFAALEERILKVRSILERGEFKPEPFKVDHCKRCEWREACRAPHLELQ